VTVADEVIAIAYLRKRLSEQREVWQAQLDAARRAQNKPASLFQALGAREAFRIAIVLCDEALDLLEPRKEYTKHNGS